MLMCLVGAVGQARAEEQVSNYRSQLLAVDVASMAMLFVPLAFDEDLPKEPALWSARVGLAAIGFGGAAVHLVHGQGRRAMSSVALRAGFAAAGLAAGSLVPCEDRGLLPCEYDGMAIGALVGISVMMAIEARHMSDLPAAPPRVAGRTWAPYLVGTQAGVQGSF
ncbi:MAG TPA: hypothetical protein VK427_25620 [Kofleriaceae bacterium]|nr:hypothetical protein [Kofleriaceae bacterium]